VALAAVALVCASPAASGRQDPFHDSCEYVQAGPPGPRGNKLVVIDPYTTNIWRDGEGIVVSNGGPRCEGGTPTVHNVDRIVVHAGGEGFGFFGHHGRLGPGATPEKGRSEIELTVYAHRIDLEGTTGNDLIVARSRNRSLTVFDLDRGSGPAAHDFDIALHARSPGVRIEGDDGDDRIDARGLTEKFRRDRILPAFRLVGGHGDDAIVGGDEGEWIKADAGNDLVLAGRGDDDVDIGRGRDRAYGGPGDDSVGYEGYERFTGWVEDPPDRLFGGPGNDRLDDLNHHVDLIRCGPGRDHVEVGRISRDRAAPDCEQKY
jgi:Ca2+-binding RTX toxin-like protein